MIRFRNESFNQIFYATKLSHGFDICCTAYREIVPMETALVNTGLYLDIDINNLDYIPDIKICPRSSMSAKGILCHTGTIDIDYKGEIKVCLTNLSPDKLILHNGDRIAQIIINTALVLNDIERRNIERIGGFGSTNL
jgi:dUTP pyrophosphatase